MNILQYSIHFCGFLALVGLRLMPYILQGAWWSHSWHHVVAFANNCWTRSSALGYWLFHFSSVFDSDKGKKTFAGKRLSQISMYVALFPLALIGTVNFVTVGSYIVSNHLLGSIMVRHMKLLLVLSLLSRVYYLMRCTHNALRGVTMNSFDST